MRRGIDMIKLENPADQEVHRVVVKLVTTSWHDDRGIHIRRDLNWVKRKSCGNQFLDEDCSMVGADQVWPRIVNLNECKDGIYEVNLCNVQTDWETGHADSYDYRLTPFA